jgi:predicted phosphodiesterase
MRILHLTDMHLRAKSGADRMAEQAAALASVADAVESIGGVDGVLVTGDLYGLSVPYRSFPEERSTLALALADLASQLRPGGPGVIVVYGNHDAPGELEILEAIPGVRVVSAAESFEGPGWWVGAMAYPPKAATVAAVDGGVSDTRTALEASLSTLLRTWRRPEGDTRIRIVAGHANVRGGTISGGEVLQHAEPELLVSDLDALGADAIALGHLHEYQRAGDRGIFPGSPWQVSAGEAERLRGPVIYAIGERLRPFPVGQLRAWMADELVGGRAQRTEVWRLPLSVSPLRSFKLEALTAADPDLSVLTGDHRIASVRVTLVLPAGSSARLGPLQAAVAAAVGECRSLEVRAVTEAAARVREASAQVAAAVTVEDQVRAWASGRQPAIVPEDADKVIALIQSFKNDEEGQ